MFNFLLVSQLNVRRFAIFHLPVFKKKNVVTIFMLSLKILHYRDYLGKI